jgi:hypothetical protein
MEDDGFRKYEQHRHERLELGKRLGFQTFGEAVDIKD